MNRPKALLFDLGNVLFEIDIPGCSQRIYDLLDPSTDRQQFRLDFKEKNEGLETGDISKGVFINFILSHCRRDVQALEVIQAWNSMLIGMPAKHLDMLAQLRRHYQLYILSNINPIHIKRFKEMIIEDHSVDHFDSLFNQVFYSSEIGFRKPNADCFEFVLEQIGLPAKQVLFMDDTMINVEAAQKQGIQSLHIPEFHDSLSTMQSLFGKAKN